MSQLKAFSIIEFPPEEGETNSIVEAVPSVWLSNDLRLCSWPPENVSSLITNAISSPKQTWKKHPITRIFTTCATYAEAKKAAKHYETHSDAEIESETERRTRYAKRSRPSETSCQPGKSAVNVPSGNLYASPFLALAQQNVDQNQHRFEVDSFAASSNQASGVTEKRTESYTPRTTATSTRRINLFPSPAPISTTQPIGHTEIYTVQPADFHDNLSGAEEIQNDRMPWTFPSVPIYQTQGISPFLPPPSGIFSETENTNSADSFQKHVIRHLVKIESTQKDILKLLNSIAGNTAASVNVNDREYFSSLPEFPLSSLDDLTRFDDYLCVNENYDRGVKYFSLIGGSSIELVVKGILKRLLSREFALSISFTGKGKGNISFSQHGRVLNLVIGSTRRNQLASTAAEDTIKKVCMDYFRFLKPKSSNNQ